MPKKSTTQKKITPKRGNVIARFKTFYKTLNDSEKLTLYRVFTALRGPDFKDADDDLKIKTASRIRVVAGFEIEEAILNHYPLTKIERGYVNQLTDSGSTHYMAHVRQAFKELEALGYKI